MKRFTWGFDNPHFDFVGQRWIAFTVDGLLLVIVIISLWFQGLNLGIDFSGGVLMEVSRISGPPIGEAEEADQIRHKVEALGFGKIEVQSVIGAKGARSVVIRVPPVGKVANQEQEVANQITAALGSNYRRDNV